MKWIPALDKWRSRDQGFWVYRFFSVLLGTLAVWQTWWRARRIGGVQVGLAAGALASVLPGLVQDAHYSRPEAFLTVLTLAAVTLSLPLHRFSSWRVFVAAALLGVALACKISMLALVWLPLISLLTVDGLGLGLRRCGLAIGLTLAGLTVGFAVGAPDAVAHLPTFWHGVDYLTQQYAGLHPPHSALGGGMVAELLLRYYLSTLGWLLVLSSLCGAVCWWRGRRWMELAVFAGPLVLFIGYFCTRSVFFERNLSHVLPLFAVLAAVGLKAVGQWISRRSGLPTVWGLAALLGLALWRPTDITIRLLKEFSGVTAVGRAMIMEDLRKTHLGLAWREIDLLNLGPLIDLKKYFEGAGGPLLIRVIDYHDEWSAFYGPMLQAQFDAQLLVTMPSAFADVSGCTLHTYSSWTDRFYLVRGELKNAVTVK